MRFGLCADIRNVMEVQEAGYDFIQHVSEVQHVCRRYGDGLSKSELVEIIEEIRKR